MSLNFIHNGERYLKYLDNAKVVNHKLDFGVRSEKNKKAVTFSAALKKLEELAQHNNVKPEQYREIKTLLRDEYLEDKKDSGKLRKLRKNITSLFPSSLEYKLRKIPNQMKGPKPRPPQPTSSTTGGKRLKGPKKPQTTSWKAVRTRSPN